MVLGFFLGRGGKYFLTFLHLDPTLLSQLNTPVFTVCMKHCNEPVSHFSSGFDPKDLLSVSLHLSV